MAARASLAAALAEEMARWEEAGLRRDLAAAGGADFTSNDYLGLASHLAVIAGAREALERHGAGARASRLLGGGSPLDEAAEEAAARWLGAEAALLFPSGYQANLGAIAALAGPGDAILSDELNHASLVDAARLSRARVLVYRHGDAEEAERLLRTTSSARRVLVVTEGLFSMDGDRAPLGRLLELCERQGAWLVVDEAHACGVVGPQGAGACAELGDGALRSPALAARIATGGKALGVAGAFVAGGAALREHLINRARTFVFTTAPPPAVAGGLRAAIEVCRGADGRRERARGLARRLATALGLPEPAGAIVPIVIGAAEEAIAAARRLQERGLSVRAVRPPTVPEGTSRLRVVCHAFNTDAELERLIDALAPMAGRSRPAASSPPPELAEPLFVAGTDTGVGKTLVSALLLRAAVRLGRAAYWKPVQTGSESDTATVAHLAGVAPHLEPAYRFAKPAAPHEAAAAEGRSISIEHLDRELWRRRADLGPGALIAELAGGLLVPLTDDATQIDWLARLRPQLVLVARSGVGTLNHTLLSLEALRARHLEPRALFLVGPPHPSNRETLRRLGGIEPILEVPPLEPLDIASLDRWLAAHDLRAVLPEPAGEPETAATR